VRPPRISKIQRLSRSTQELGEAMKGLDVRQMDEKDMLSTRGW